MENVQNRGISKVNSTALAQFDRTLDLSKMLESESDFRPAEWFDTTEKRLKWWLDLEPQWRQAFNQAVFFRKKTLHFSPGDQELQFLFEQKSLDLCGAGEFKNRNNRGDLDFQLTNVTGVRNLTRLERLEVDYNGQIESLEPLAGLLNLEVLWADNNQIVDLSPLAGLHNLRTLCVWNNRIEDISPVSCLEKLQNLTLGLYNQGNPVKSWAPILVGFPSLFSVEAMGCEFEDFGDFSAAISAKGVRFRW